MNENTDDIRAWFGSGPTASIDWGTKIYGNTVTYSFANAGTSTTFGEEISLGDSYTAESFTGYEKAQFRAAFQMIENITNLRFSETNSYRSADLRLMVDTNEHLFGELGAMVPAGETGAGIGVFNGSFWDRSSGGDLEQGGFSFTTIVHEVLHGLGLAHPHDTGGYSGRMRGVYSSFDDYGSYNLNQGVYTTMTYNNGLHTGNIGQRTGTVLNFGYEAGPMALDIAALQEKYGANTSFARGNNIYDLVDRNGQGTKWMSIWDGGGNDMIRYRGARDATIDLRAATLEYETGGGGFLSAADGIRGGFTVASGVVIERAQGGTGNDKITGNTAANILNGNNGHDTVGGGDGQDVISGGNGNDRLFGGAQNDRVWGNNGNDTLSGEAGYDTLYGGAGRDMITGGDGNDSITGGTGNDTLDGGGGNDTLRGGDGFDLIRGDDGNDSIAGDKDNDTLDGGAGRDTIDGGAGHDLIRGGDNDDDLRGWVGNDVLYGGSGNDVITDISGTNRLIGHGGNDTLAGGWHEDKLSAGSGDDVASGGGGADTLNGQGGADVLKGNNGHDTLNGGTGNDTLSGNALNDLLLGGGGSDRMYGGTNADTLSGSSGNDWLFGGDDNDLLTGGSGRDVFVFGADMGRDVITDFDLTRDTLRIDDALLSGESSGNEVILVYGSQNGSGVTLNFGGGDRMIIEGVSAPEDLPDLGDQIVIF